MKKISYVIICLGIIISIIISIYLLDKYLPEFYIAEEDKCVIGYDDLGFMGMEDNDLIHCGRKHYLLGGIDYIVLNRVLYYNSLVKNALKIYNCNLDIDHKIHCTDPSDCSKRSDLEGCHRDADDCNWCCDNWCHLVACIKGEFIS